MISLPIQFTKVDIMRVLVTILMLSINFGVTDSQNQFRNRLRVLTKIHISIWNRKDNFVVFFHFYSKYFCLIFNYYFDNEKRNFLCRPNRLYKYKSRKNNLSDLLTAGKFTKVTADSILRVVKPAKCANKIRKIRYYNVAFVRNI